MYDHLLAFLLQAILLSLSKRSTPLTGMTITIYKQLLASYTPAIRSRITTDAAVAPKVAGI